jgi:hypothetical protein
MDIYIAELHHDNGIKRIRTAATSKDEAILKFIKAEGCPKIAVKNVKKV